MPPERSVLRVKGRPDDVLPRLFRAAEDGRVHFGLGGYSVDATAVGALEAGPVLFREMILERLSQYELLVSREPGAARLSIHALGSDVDRHAAIIGWIRWSIERLGFEVLQGR